MKIDSKALDDYVKDNSLSSGWIDEYSDERDSVKELLKCKFARSFIDGFDTYSFFNERKTSGVYQIIFVNNDLKVEHDINLHINNYYLLSDDLTSRLEIIVRDVKRGVVFDFERAKGVKPDLVDYRNFDIKDAVPIGFVYDYLKSLNAGIQTDEFMDSVLDFIHSGNRVSGVCTDSISLITREIVREELGVYCVHRTIRTLQDSDHACLVCFDLNGGWVFINGKRARDDCNDFMIVPASEFSLVKNMFVI